MKIGQRGLLLAATGLLAGASGAVPPPQPANRSLSAQVDAYIRTEMQNRRIPGLAVAVVRDGHIVATQAYGLANLELNVPVTLDTIFPIASLDKQLTASGILLLTREGKVRLDDEVSGYFPDPPGSWKGIRVAHLLSHASGLPDVVNEEIDGRALVSYTTGQLLSNVKRQILLFPPGTGYHYSDAGFFLGQLITEKASGMPWRQFVTEQLFKPAEMNSMVYLDPAAVIKNRVSGHELTANGEIISNRRTAVDLGPLYNDVGANVVDFARWAAALETDRVVPAAVRNQMWSPQVRANDILYWRDYGFGWGLDSYRGVRVVLHSGYTGVAIVVLPEQRISAIVFTNLDNHFGTDAEGLALGVIGFYVPEVSLVSLPSKPDPDPARMRRVRSELGRLINGDPDYSQYARSLFHGIKEGAADLATRVPHFGALQSLSFLEERADENLVYYRADFAKARLFLRVGFDGEGKISCFQMTHI